MAKSSQEQLNTDEKKVLKVLRKNGKGSIEDVAKQCGFSRQKVWRIVKKLEKNKTIWGYSAICDDDSAEYKHYIVLMKRSTTPISDKVLNEILTTELDALLPEGVIEIENIEYVHGIYDGVFSFRTDGIVNAKKFCERFNEHFQGFVSEIQLL